MKWCFGRGIWKGICGFYFLFFVSSTAKLNFYYLRANRAPLVRMCVKIMHLICGRGEGVAALDGLYVHRRLVVAVMGRLARSGFPDLKGEGHQDAGLVDVAGEFSWLALFV